MESRKDLHIQDRGLVTMEGLLTQALLMFRYMTLLFLCVLNIEIKLVNLSVVWSTRLLMSITFTKKC